MVQARASNHFFHFGSLYDKITARANANAVCVEGKEYPSGNPPTTVAASSAEDGRSLPTRGFKISSEMLQVNPAATAKGRNNR